MSNDPYSSLPPNDPPYSTPYTGPAGGPLPPDRSEAASKKLAAGLTGILLGTFGVHKFVLGYTTPGIVMLAVSLASLVIGIPTCGVTWPVTGVMGVIGLVEGIIYLTMSDDQFYRTYMLGKKEWF